MKEENPLNRRIESFLDRIGASRAGNPESDSESVPVKLGIFVPVTLTDEDIVEFRIENLN